MHEKFDVSTGPNTKTFQGHLFAVHYEKIRNHLRETATSSAKIHSLAQKIRTSADKSDSITIFFFFSTFNNTIGHSYGSLGIQKRKIYFH